MVEELSRTIALPARGEGITGPSVRHILFTLKGELKEKYLMPVLRGEKKVAFAQTEPDAGSDPGGMRTTAVKDGNHYVINGTKRFITGADKAHFMQLMAATDRAKGSRGGISCFLVDMDTPGVKLGTSYQTMMGDRPWEIILDNVRVPAENLVGEEGKGFGLGAEMARRRPRQARRARARRRRALPRNGDVLRQAALDLRPAARRAGRRSSGSSRDMYIELQAARLLVYKAATPARRRRGRARGLLRLQILRRRDGVPRRRRMHADPRRHRAHHRPADREDSGASSAATASPKAPAK